MKIIQSFWSGGRDMIENRFGWVSPQYHLMAWALSCLKIKEFYPNLHLYTDSNGFEVLIKRLKLPYKSVDICYDNIPYNKHHWAATKIMSYAKQHEPFIHVDADVFIWERFNSDIENGGLIAQNLEHGTEYSRDIIKSLRDKIEGIPAYLNDELNKESIPSYNAGILGGHDIAFFQKFAEQSLALVDANNDSIDDERMSLNFNILFEQILFSALSIKENKKVTTFFKDAFDDKGYYTPMFADFSKVAIGQTYFHLIGGQKRNKSICELMSSVLLKHYPEHYFRIISLFPKRHRYFHSKVSLITPAFERKTEKRTTSAGPGLFRFPRTRLAISQQYGGNENGGVSHQEISFFVEHSGSVVIKQVYQYEVVLSSLFDKWQHVPAGDLYSIERTACHYFPFFGLHKAEQLDVTLTRHPFLEIIEDSFHWSQDSKRLINIDIGLAPFEDSDGIACIPRLFLKGYDEILIDKLDYNILTLLKVPLTLRGLLESLKPYFSDAEIEEDYAAIYKLFIRKLKHLFHSKCIFIEGTPSRRAT